jgi:hypothetical protein
MQCEETLHGIMSYVETSHWGVSKSITSFGGMRCMRETRHWVRCSKLLKQMRLFYVIYNHLYMICIWRWRRHRSITFGYTPVHPGYSCVGMCTRNGCPNTLLFITCCSGTSSRCTYLLDGAGGIRYAQTSRLSSGDAFSVFSAIRMGVSMARENQWKFNHFYYQRDYTDYTVLLCRTSKSVKSSVDYSLNVIIQIV